MHQLIDRGADVNQSAGTLSIVGLATMLGDDAIMQKCLARVDSANDLNSVPLLAAAERGDVGLLRQLLAKGGRIDKVEFFHGTTPLMLAAQGPGGPDAPPLAGDDLVRQVATVRFLIERGANVNVTEHSGNTALGNAVRRGHTEIAKLLIDRAQERRSPCREVNP